ncbi:hypothetical protein NK718_21520 [Alsobacter sp. SYSU M60028]|uniref:Uncharacterized protein n=1 Tax=Alsobacter ponti TaxID=2962936 RepID=A0ABT1LI50_9HYPH|nr:hypothetical protein [Alsobacter ponti]MCP8941109.1 hypothetical protein [Alsobacter ponti]
MTDVAYDDVDDTLGLADWRHLIGHLEAARAAAIGEGIAPIVTTEAALLWALRRAFDADPEGFATTLIRAVRDVVHD